MKKKIAKWVTLPIFPLERLGNPHQISYTKSATKIDNGAKYVKWKEKCSRQISNFEVICANPSDGIRTIKFEKILIW